MNNGDALANMAATIHYDTNRLTIELYYEGQITLEQLEGVHNVVLAHLKNSPAFLAISLRNFMMTDEVTSVMDELSEQLIDIITQPDMYHVVFVIPGRADSPMAAGLQAYYRSLNMTRKLSIVETMEEARRLIESRYTMTS